MERLAQIPEFDYQLYFQEPGVAEAELEKDIGRTLKILIRSSSPEDRLPFNLDLHRVRERGGLLVGFPQDPPESRLLPPEVPSSHPQFRRGSVGPRITPGRARRVRVTRGGIWIGPRAGP
ncbi:bifunctional epoxide hydrolase 2-like [Camarhynchus parvulus]|uniref:bifunctional epoxide hydrolase 2-like n=1 Tax=Geospiza parvula TaxID=87175 RepID=UPI001237BDFF|nr:bifunctional epoxide hydrolase 2-like [Camarhynchus parvulus]